jgi:hypothetical protein
MKEKWSRESGAETVVFETVSSLNEGLGLGAIVILLESFDLNRLI